MARDVLTVVQMPGAQASAATDLGTAFTFVPANDAQYAAQGNEVIWVHNVTAGAAIVTFNKTADRQGRTGVEATGGSVPAGAWALFGPIPLEGFAQADGTVQIDSDTAIEILVLRP